MENKDQQRNNLTFINNTLLEVREELRSYKWPGYTSKELFEKSLSDDPVMQKINEAIDKVWSMYNDPTS